MYTVTLPKSTTIVYSIFGIQHPKDQVSPLTTQLFNLLTPHLPQTNITTLTQDNPHSSTTIHLAYWPTKTSYETWWNSPPVTTFWTNLPDDAGIWREIIWVSPERTQHSTNKPTSYGMGCLGPYRSCSDKSGYWGCYYHRIPATATSPEDRYPSPRKENPPRRLEGTGTVRSGRVHMRHFPKNLCFVVEGQDHSAITDPEKEVWNEKFEGNVERWMGDLQSATPEMGLLGMRMCYEERSGRFRDQGPPELGSNLMVQLFYFLDMESMEWLGRANKWHVALRREFLKTYGPGGEVADNGGLCLWVETSILDVGELECEYIGCVDGTGLMGYAREFEGTSSI
ncbi:hem-containing dehydratase protein [Aspergillus coremiiformis]|uniref:Hem-containing dehydratase protein n=1 Tax=Aspergillus coremiiformis TaxID=138285 RepID=A0A5N6Z9E0_9EURO|nr:hem-containing dehydratase protein [Aspergillus coremiiformis]